MLSNKGRTDKREILINLYLILAHFFGKIDFFGKRVGDTLRHSRLRFVLAYGFMLATGLQNQNIGPRTASRLGTNTTLLRPQLSVGRLMVFKGLNI